jgi:hypothetical protein
MKLRFAVTMLAALGLLATGGCGSKGPKLVRISGTVKYSDGSALVVPEGGRAIVTFTPADTTGELAPGVIRKGASGVVKEGGKFEMQTVKPGDGVSPNRYKVFITAQKNLAANPMDPANRFVPEKYAKAETSGWEITVENKSRSDVEFTMDK